MADRDDELWQSLRSARGRLFSRPQDLKDIALGRVRVPEKYVPEDAPLSVDEVKRLTFGQLLGYYAELLHLDIAAVADKCRLTPETVTEVYDDTRFPWDFSADNVLGFAQALSIPYSMVLTVVEHQPLEDDVLLERMPGSAMAARTTKNLRGPDREKDLRASNVAIQRNREDRQRQKFLRALGSLVDNRNANPS